MVERFGVGSSVIVGIGMGGVIDPHCWNKMPDYGHAFGSGLVAV